MEKFNYSEIESYYDKPYWDTPGVKSGYHHMTGALGGRWHAQACEWFNSVIPVEGKTLLDAGCGLGHFMYAFSKLGAVCSGIDASSFCFDFVRTHCEIPVYQSRLEDASMISPDSIDILFLLKHPGTHPAGAHPARAFEFPPDDETGGGSYF